jgi:hypothetical protein
VNLIFAILTIALYSQQHWAKILDQELIYFLLGEKESSWSKLAKYFNFVVYMMKLKVIPEKHRMHEI